MQMGIFDLRTHLDQLRDGRKLHDIVGLVLQILLLVAGVSLVGTWWRTWSPGEGLKFFGWVALVIWQLVWPFAVFLALQALFLRAAEVRRLPASRYIVAPMVELLLRGLGEFVLVASLVFAVPAMLVVWFSGPRLLFQLLTTMPGLTAMPGLAFFLPLLNGPRFWSGLAALVSLPAQGLITLLVAYFVAEALTAGFAVAEDVRALRSRASDAMPEDHG